LKKGPPKGLILQKPFGVQIPPKSIEGTTAESNKNQNIPKNNIISLNKK
jgi:hypothetical protein